MDDTPGSGSEGAQEVPVPAKSPNFISHMLSLDSAAKAQLLNLVQYSAICVIPVVALLKLVQHFFPEHDPAKSNADLAMESIAQIAVIVVGIWFIDRFVRYFGTYSGTPYSPFSPTTFVAPLILLMVTMQSKLGRKMTSLTDRVAAMAGIQIGREGMEDGGKKKEGKTKHPKHHPAPVSSPAPPPSSSTSAAPHQPKLMPEPPPPIDASSKEVEKEAFAMRGADDQVGELEAYSFGAGGGGLGGSVY